MRKDLLPKCCLAGPAIGAELGRDDGRRGLGDGVFRVAGQVRKDGAGERPAGPGAPASGGGARAGEAVGVVLEVDARVADEGGGRGMAQQPDERGVGWQPVAQHGLVTAQVGPEGAVEAQDGTGGEAALPERVGVFEAVVVKFRTTHVLAVDVQRAPVEAGAGRREAGAGWSGR